MTDSCTPTRETPLCRCGVPLSNSRHICPAIEAELRPLAGQRLMRTLLEILAELDEYYAKGRADLLRLAADFITTPRKD